MHDKTDELASQITEENFETMQEIYRLKEAGNMEGVKALMADFEMFGFETYDKGMMGGHWKK